jgi:hypothetical protein
MYNTDPLMTRQEWFFENMVPLYCRSGRLSLTVKITHSRPGDATKRPYIEVSISKSTVDPLVMQLADIMAHFCCREELLEGCGIVRTICDVVPGIDSAWKENEFVWDELTLEAWYAGLKIDHAHGSRILKVMTSTQRT